MVEVKGTFYGRQQGAIGVMYTIDFSVNVEKATQETVRLAIYEKGYEHVSLKNQVEVREAGTEEFRPFTLPA